MNYTERVLSFGCEGDPLLGILSVPEQPKATAVLVIVGGPQYRVGSHRQFVLLARHLAETGHPVLRFDCRGMGDSLGQEPGFENINRDVGCAIDALQAAQPGTTGVALWGLCDGASAALLYCDGTQDPRVQGLCLLNPWVRSETSLARAQVKHYYTQRLMQKEFWLKLLSGKVAAGALSGLFRSLKSAFATPAGPTATDSQAPFQARMARAWKRFKGPILLLLSGNDLTAKEFLEQVNTAPYWAGSLNQPSITRHDLAEADHTFSNHKDRSSVETLTAQWLHRCATDTAR